MKGDPDKSDWENAISVLESLFLLSLILISAGLIISLTVSGGAANNGPAGVVPSVLGSMGGILVPGGETYLFSRESARAGNIDLVVPPKMSGPGTGPLLVPGVHLPVGYLAAVLIGECNVTLKAGGDTENLFFSQERPLPTGSWTVAGMRNRPPFRNQDGDMLLEPGEQADLVINPQGIILPGQAVTLTVLPKNGFPLVITGKSPVKTNPVNILGA